jgi:16S rRNA (adenine1518-N6/adenine1519-N6)-dimethyltransferase
LISNEVLDAIVEAAALDADSTVIEVGPGRGVVTSELLKQAGNVIAVEIDERLCSHLREVFGDREHFHLLCADVLDVAPSEVLRSGKCSPPYVLVGNLPYYITAPILRHFLEGDEQPARLVIMLQWEVARNILAAPGDMSLLAVSVQFYAEPSLVTRVPANAFYPPPEVESAVIRLDVRSSPAVDVEGDIDGFFSVVRAGFRAPRKQLHNALPQGLWLEPGEADVILREAGIDPMRRAQTMSLEEWQLVWRAYRKRHPRRDQAA